MGAPDFGNLFYQLWGGGQQGYPAFGLIAAATNIVIGNNPAWGAADFFGIYPKFGGTSTAYDGTLNGFILSDITQTAGISNGWPVTGLIVGPSTTVAAVNSPTQITLSNPGTGSGPTSVNIFNPANYLCNAIALNAYIALASASVIQARWGAAWSLGMALFTAHYCTLWYRSDGNPCNVPGMQAAAGLARGITVSKSVGPASQSIEPTPGLEDWSAFNLTDYGVQFATIAKTITTPTMYFY